MTAVFYQREDQFYVAVDCVIFGFHYSDLYVVIWKRKIEPQKGKWSLMGGFVKTGESLEQAASRVLIENTGINHLFMEQVGAYGAVNRDTGDHVISVAYFSVINMNSFSNEMLSAFNAKWCRLSEVPELVFDHNQMIRDTLAILKKRASAHPVGFNVLPEKFTLTQLQNLYEAVYQTPLDKRNFRKKILSLNILDKLDEKDKKNSKRGAYLYKFNKEKYNKLREEGYRLSI